MDLLEAPYLLPPLLNLHLLLLLLHLLLHLHLLPRPSTYVEFFVRGRGPLASVGVDLMAFLHSGVAGREGEEERELSQEERPEKLEKGKDACKLIDDAEAKARCADKLEIEGEGTVEKTEAETPEAEAGKAEVRPDYQLLFMSSWLLADYWTLVYRTFGLDMQAWEGAPGPLIWIYMAKYKVASSKMR